MHRLYGTCIYHAVSDCEVRASTLCSMTTLRALPLHSRGGRGFCQIQRLLSDTASSHPKHQASVRYLKESSARGRDQAKIGAEVPQNQGRPYRRCVTVPFPMPIPHLPKPTAIKRRSLGSQKISAAPRPVTIVVPVARSSKDDQDLGHASLPEQDGCCRTASWRRSNGYSASPRDL